MAAVGGPGDPVAISLAGKLPIIPAVRVGKDTDFAPTDGRRGGMKETPAAADVLEKRRVVE